MLSMFVSLRMVSGMAYIIVDLPVVLTQFCHVTFLTPSKPVAMTKGLLTFLTHIPSLQYAFSHI